MRLNDVMIVGSSAFCWPFLGVSRVFQAYFGVFWAFVQVMPDFSKYTKMIFRGNFKAPFI